MAASLATLPRLRPGIEIIRTGPRSFTLHNTRTGEHFELNAEERFLLHLLERSDSLEDVQPQYETRFKKGLSEQHLLEFLEQLRQRNLVVDAGDSAVLPVHAFSRELPASAAPAPLSSADPGRTLNGFFDALTLLFGWLLHPLWLVPLVLLATIATFAVIANWNRFVSDQVEIWSRYPFIPLIIALYLKVVFLVNLPCVLVVGMACRRFGGRVRAFKLHFWQGLIPVFSVEVGDSPVLMSDRGKWTVYAAALWCELALGSWYALLWASAAPGSSGGKFFAMLVLPCLIGLLSQSIIFFNGPAYWALCQAVGDWQLRDRALAVTRAWLARRRSPEALTAPERFWFGFYGLSYYVFNIFFHSALVIGGSYFLVMRFEGVGALVASVLILWFYRDPIGGFLMATGPVQWLVWLLRCGGLFWVRWPIRMALLLGGLVALGLLPYRHEIEGECRTIPCSQVGIRSEVSDVIAEMHVSEGSYVQPGTLIATLSGRTLSKDISETTYELAGAQAELDMMRSGYRPEDIQIAAKKVEIAETQLNYYDDLVRRSEALLRKNAISQQEYENYKKEYFTAQDELVVAQENYAKAKAGYREEEIRGAEAKVNGLQERLGYQYQLLSFSRIATKTGGRVVTPYMEERIGQSVAAGDLVAVIQDTSRLLIEVAADDATATRVKVGMPVKIRLHGLDGRLLTGRVQRIAWTGEQAAKFGNAPIRTDREMNSEQSANSRFRDSSYHVRVYVALDDYPPDLTPEMYGYARIVVEEDDVLWRAAARPVVRFLRTDVWSWMP